MTQEGRCDILTLFFIFPQEDFHFSGEVDVAVTGASFRSLDEDLVAGDLHGVAANVDGTLYPVDILPLQGAALAPPHSCGDDELEVGFVFDALLLQCGNDLLHRFLISDLPLQPAACIAVGAPRGIMHKK